MLDHLDQIGFIFKAYRTKTGMSQEQLAQRCGLSSRTPIALLEQGRRLPRPEDFVKIASELGIPEEIYAPFAQAGSVQRQEFEACLGELIGRTVTLKIMHLESIRAVEQLIRELFSGDLSTEQCFEGGRRKARRSGGTLNPKLSPSI